MKHRFGNSMMNVQTILGADIESDHNLLVTKICTRLKKIVRFWKGKPESDLEKLIARLQKVWDALEKKNSVELNMKVEQYQEICVRYCEWGTWLRKSKGEQESQGLQRKLSVKWMNDESGRMSTTHIKDQEGMSPEHMRWDHRISKTGQCI
jgi:hypothetical protein